MDGRSLLDNLADRFKYKIQEYNVNDWTAAGERRSYAQPGLTALRYRGVAHTLFAKFCMQSAALLEIPSPSTDPLSHVEDTGVTTHLLANGFHPGFCVRNQAQFAGTVFGTNFGCELRLSHFSLPGL